MVSAAGEQKRVETELRLPTAEQVWRWLGEIPDPEIPVVSVVDLGIVREVRWEHGGGRDELVVAVTPTYSGCPATTAILLAIECKLRAKGVKDFRLERRLAPPWTTEWISTEGRRKLREFGIAPPVESGRAPSPFERGRVVVCCPRCGSDKTERISEFGSTPCKAQYRCRTCLEPFEYFKCI